MESLLLLDADIIIHLFEQGYWNAVISRYKVYVASIVLREVKYYCDAQGKKITIDLFDYVNRGQIKEVEATPEEQAILLDRLREDNLDSLDAGELECIAILFIDRIPDIQFCVKDTLAIRALVALDLHEKALSLEEILRNAGVLRRKDRIAREFSKKKLSDLTLAEKLNHL